jgi:hypothetical protein
MAGADVFCAHAHVTMPVIATNSARGKARWGKSTIMDALDRVNRNGSHFAREAAQDQFNYSIESIEEDLTS